MTNTCARRSVINTNTVEGYYSIFKRGMKGVYQHCKEKHLHRYLAEFDFRYSNRIRLGVDDVERTARAVKGIVGKRLTYAHASSLRGLWEKQAQAKKQKRKPRKKKINTSGLVKSYNFDPLSWGIGV